MSESYTVTLCRFVAESESFRYIVERGHLLRAADEIERLECAVAEAEAERDNARHAAREFWRTLTEMSAGLPGLETWSESWREFAPWLEEKGANNAQ